MLSLLSITLLGCVAAWSPGNPGRFDLAPPVGWSVTRNYRWLRTDHLVLARVQAAISLRLEPSRGLVRTLPLGVLAPVRALSWGRPLGIQSSLVAEHEIVVDGRRGYAVTGVRRLGPSLIGYSTVIVRTEERLLELSLLAPPASLEAQASAWSAVLGSLRLADPPEPIPTFVDESWPR